MFVAPGHKLLHLLPVWTFVVVGDEGVYCCVVCELDEVDGSGLRDAVVGLQREQQRGARALAQPCGAPLFSVMVPEVLLPILTVCGLSIKAY